MNTANESAAILPDPAGVLGCALSLWQACQKCSAIDRDIDFSESYHGTDQFMREVMRVATQFEEWACSHIDFNRFEAIWPDGWPCVMENAFGDACLETVSPTELASFDDSSCLRVALRLQFPVRFEGRPPLPVDVTALNPSPESPFKKLKIQTVRDTVKGGFPIPYKSGDQPFDEEFQSPYFSLYGIAGDGVAEHIADRSDYEDAVKLAQKIMPGIQFPDSP